MCTNNHVKSCCQSSARNSESAYCNQCGDPLLKCGAFNTCKGLLNSESYCPICFSPELRLMSSPGPIAVGDSTHLEFALSNRSPASRNLLVKNIWVRIGNSDWKQLDLAWDRLGSGQTKLLEFTTPPMETGGSQGIEFVLVLASLNGFRQEVLAFNATLSLHVESSKDIVVQQNIHYAAEAPQTGATIYAPVRVQSDLVSGKPGGQGPQVLELHRAQKYDRLFANQLADQCSVHPATLIEYHDVPLQIKPPVQMLGQRMSQLIFGRSRTIEHGGPNDFRLLYLSPDRSIDDEASLQISRQHFCLFAEQGVLKIRVLSEGGVLLNGKKLLPGTAEIISNGSCIDLKSNNSRIRLQLAFQESNELVDRIQIRRS